MKTRVNIGCGRAPTPGWLNFDNSIAIKLANSPSLYFIARSLKLLNKSQINNIEWNKKNKISYADATKKIPLEKDSVECIYTSHMLEHLSRDEVSNFLKESLRVLESDGTLRVAVPNLRKAINNYIIKQNADDFMSEILVQAPPINTFRQKLHLLITGYRHHQWMYDDNSLCLLLKSFGFRNVKVYKEGETQIKNYEGLDLYERSEDSVYVEGIK